MTQEDANIIAQIKILNQARLMSLVPALERLRKQEECNDFKVNVSEFQNSLGCTVRA